LYKWGTTLTEGSLLGAAAVAAASASVMKETVSPMVATAADIVAPVKEISEVEGISTIILVIILF